MSCFKQPDCLPAHIYPVRFHTRPLANGLLDRDETALCKYGLKPAMTPLKHAQEDRPDYGPQEGDARHEAALIKDFNAIWRLAQAALVNPPARLEIG